ncbi:hypothetical protein MNBD_ALPHA06-739 [hydrothermal vent metagenome]|uniref:PepSY domain-containing protein n=1 Tax=hydrothermal vent metagenome TaxID=652676 RepID=A0A3B0S676_9ZZZZ
MKRIEYILLIFVLGFVLANIAPTTVYAAAQFQSSFTADQARNARKQGKVLGASQSMRIVQRRYPNLKVADTRLLSDAGKGVRYLVKMLSNDGRVVEVTVDAQTGKILETRGN